MSLVFLTQTLNIKFLDFIVKQLQFLPGSSSCPVKSEAVLIWRLGLGSNIFWTFSTHKDNTLWDKKIYKQDDFLSKCTIVQHVRPRFFLSHKLDHWANYVYLTDSGIMTGHCVSFFNQEHDTFLKSFSRQVSNQLTRKASR